MVIKKISGIVLILFIYFLNPTAIAEECTSCHNIRHGLTGNSCDNCHYNTTFSNGKHIQKPFSPGFVHDSLDWEKGTTPMKKVLAGSMKAALYAM